MNMRTLAAGLALICAASAAAAEWISVPEAPVFEDEAKKGSRAADGTSWFACTFTNGADVVSARWTVAGLGVFEAYANGHRVGEDFLKPGFTHWAKTKYSFSYDVTALLDRRAGAPNTLAAEVSAGWWRDKTVTRDGHRGFMGRKSAFRGELVLAYADGRRETVGTDCERWRCGIAGAVTHAAIFDGETYDARRTNPVRGEGLVSRPEPNREFSGELLPSAGGEVVLRRDLAMTRGPFSLRRGEKLVVDFGQNCAAVPEFVFRAKRGTTLSVLPGEMLNDADAPARGCDGPKGSVYRANLKIPDGNMRLDYTFSGDGTETYLPRFTFFGYRYLSLEATDDVEIERVTSVPVSSVTPEMEIGSLEVGDPALNRFVGNVRWSMLSNYLNVPMDCPQRNERLGWAADTQVFCEAGCFLADTRRFFAKFMRDMRDTCSPGGGFPSVAPYAQYGGTFFAFGWADAGVIVPWTVWRQFGDVSIVRDNWEAMAKFVRAVEARRYDFEGTMNCIYADWLSCETFESRGNAFGDWEKWKDDPDARNYRLYLAACYWLYDARLMAEMAAALGRADEAAYFRGSAARALAYVRGRFLEGDGQLLKPMRHLQTACVFALRHGIVEGAAKDATLDRLVTSIREHDGCLQTGFLGTSFILDALSGAGATDVAYDLLLNHRCPGWLYSVDQGATTVWERWNSYTKKDGFGPARMNSFNHYAYGGVLGWIFRTVAGISADASAPGFRRVILAPKPDRRLGFCTASCRTSAGLVRSAWRFEGDAWTWEFEVPDGATASVTVPGETAPRTYAAGVHTVRRNFTMKKKETIQ